MPGPWPMHAAGKVCQMLLLTTMLLVTTRGEDAKGGWREKTNSEGKVVQELKIEAPSFTEEDQYGYIMPERYRCDSCRAVMFHLDAELRKHQPKNRRMKQWEFTDVLDDTCRKAFEGYGIRLVNGENTLSGPGLKQEETLTPGSGAIQMSGESWTKRLGEICRRIVYEELGEDEVYDRFYRGFRAEGGAAGDADGEGAGVGLGQDLCYGELRECTTGPKPPAKQQAEPQKPKARKKGKAEKAKGTEKRARPAAVAGASPAPGTRPSTEAGAGPRRRSAALGGEEPVDVQTFLRGLARRHGLTSDEYLAERSVAEWEMLTVAMAGRIFNKHATEDRSGSCSAGKPST